MDYQIIFSPSLDVKAAEFITDWNNTAACREVGQAELAETQTASYELLDPALIQQGLIFLGGVAGTVALDVVIDLAKERLKAYLERKLPASRRDIDVEAVRQPGGAYLLVIKEKE